MWTARVRRRALRLLPPGKLLPDRQPAYVASWIYTFGVATLATLGLAISVRLRPRARRSGLVPLQLGRPLLQQHAPVERRAVHGLPGHPPVGQVLDGGLARPPGHDLDHRRHRVRGLGRGVLHRLPVPVELRLAVDRHQRQGRLQRRRRRRVLQRHELRPDADVAHRADPDRPGRDRRRARADGPGPRRRATRCPRSATLRRSRADRKAAAAADAAPWRGATRRYDILKEGTVAVAIATCLVLLMAGLLSSPDVPPLSVQDLGHGRARSTSSTRPRPSWTAPALAASYGPPYNNGTGAVQQVGPGQLAEAGRDHPADQRRPDSSSSTRCAKLAPTTPAARHRAAPPTPAPRLASSRAGPPPTTRPRSPTQQGAVQRRAPEPCQPPARCR